MSCEKVSAPEFFSLLFLSVLSTVFMYISSPQIPLAQTDAVLRPFVFIAVSLAAGVPSFLICNLMRKNEEKGLVLKETTTYRVAYSVFGIVYFIAALKTILRFDLFASSELFPGNDMSIFLIAIVIACGALSTVGLSALCRGSVIFCFIVIGATAFVMLSLADELKLLNFTPVFQNGIGTFAKDSLLFAVKATEIGAVTLFLPQIKGEFKKHYIAF
ncbi:MAG: GerAB/ArcD/ProY family transporter, partial [Clostridia bacterium]|nr:GerAB/ArcD/ProY family transporter [Clostridia bacterium]